MDEPTLQRWKATLQVRIQHNTRWSAGLHQLWTLGRARRRTDAFYLYQLVLYHPACAASSTDYVTNLLDGCKAILDNLQDLFAGLAQPSAPWPALGLSDASSPAVPRPPHWLRTLAQERAEITAELTRLTDELRAL